jgi:PAS domain S-box-containing protein
MSAFSKIQRRLEAGYQPLAVVTTILVLASLTFSLWNFAQSRVDAEARVRFDDRTVNIVEQIRGRMLDYEQVLRGCAGLFAASDTVTRKEWFTYIDALHINQNYPGMQALGFARRVSNSAKVAHEGAIRAQGFPQYAIYPSGTRDEYLPTIYIEPFTGRNVRAFGFDTLSETTRRAAVARARDTGSIAISGKLALMQDAEHRSRSGFIMYMPVYAKNTDTRMPEQRRAGFSGVVYGAFYGGDLMRGILGNTPDVRVQIYDGAGSGEQTLLYDSGDAGLANRAPRFVAGDGIVMHGHGWAVRMTSQPAFESAIDYSEPLTILASGAVISLLLLAIIWSMATLRYRAVVIAHRMTNELRESREQLSLALEGSDLAFFDWNVATGEIELSARWADMLGEPPGLTATTVDKLSALVHPDDAPRLQKKLGAVLRGEAALYEVEHRVKDKRGDWIWLLSRAKVTARDAAGKPLRVTGTNANITQRRQVERMKEEFISTVNHELRTPLTVIVGTLALLKESLTALPPEQAMMLDMAAMNSARLKLLVNDILDLEKIVLGAMQFNIEPVPLQPFLQQSLELNRIYADRFKVRYELQAPVPAVSINADRERLLQVMTNLLSNGAKFSPAGEAIVVAASVADGFARVTVADRGSGIPVEFRSRIFGKFAQADGSNTRKQEGTGLGLAISKSIIEKMGGRIGFESEPGNGAVFYFELPLADDAGKGQG